MNIFETDHARRAMRETWMTLWDIAVLVSGDLPGPTGKTDKNGAGEIGVSELAQRILRELKMEAEGKEPKLIVVPTKDAGTINLHAKVDIREYLSFCFKDMPPLTLLPDRHREVADAWVDVLCADRPGLTREYLFSHLPAGTVSAGHLIESLPERMKRANDEAFQPSDEDRQPISDSVLRKVIPPLFPPMDAEGKGGGQKKTWDYVKRVFCEYEIKRDIFRAIHDEFAPEHWHKPGR